MDGVTLHEIPYDDPQWMRLIGLPGSRSGIFHHPLWAALLADCYGFQPSVLAAFNKQNMLVAGLPLMQVKYRFGIREFSSLPFTDHCPPVSYRSGPGDDGMGEGAFVALTEQWRRQQEDHPSVGLRLHSLERPGMYVADSFYRHVTQLDADPGVMLGRFDKTRVRSTVRQAVRSGLTARTGFEWKDMLRFYNLHLLTRRRLGTPVQPLRFFRLLWERLIQTGMGSVALVERGAHTVAASVLLRWNGTVTYKYSASDPAALELRPNHLMLWYAMKSACLRGDTTFDWGRTDLNHHGLRAFKRGWAADEEAMSYVMLADAPPRPTPGGLTRRTISGLIRHSPLWVCRGIGELLYKFAA